ncbi:MAG: VOC family protein [Bacillota bacterium]|nr:VOC family protein [Bacillota bacterium]
MLHRAAERPTRLHHVGVVVENLEQAVRFYVETLGLSLESQTDLPERNLRLAFLNGIGGRVELLEYRGPRPATAHTGTVDHVALAVRDLGPAIASLEQAGIAERDEAPRPGPGGKRIYFFRGPSGERIELVEVGA